MEPLLTIAGRYMEPEDLPPDPIAQLDQTLRAMGDIATLLRGFYDALLTAGFEPTAALFLVANYHTALIQGPKPT